MRRTNGDVYIEDTFVTYKQSVLLIKCTLMYSLCYPANSDNATTDIVVVKYKISKTQR